MKTYAIQQKDFVGAIYTIGYTLANTPGEAAARAREMHQDAYSQEITTQDEMGRAIEDILDAANAVTHKRMQEAKS